MIVTLLRKPLEGSVAENTLKHGCGAINIDDTRVEGEPWKWGTQTDLKGGGFGSKRPSEGNILRNNVEGGFNGRWPANFILSHLEGCELRGTKKVKGAISKPSVGNKAKTSISMNNSKEGIHRVSHADEDGKETIADWACVEGCPVQELDRQSGRVKGWSSQNHNTFNPYQGNSFHNSSTQRQGYKEGYNDDGGASRFFKQFKKDNNQ